jgi:exodeoxyribonuclease VII large subunit
MIVPDVAEEQRRISLLRDRALRTITVRIERAHDELRALRMRPVLATPERDIDRRALELADALARAQRSLTATLDRASDDVTHLLARVRTLSPAATLERGYAIVQDADGQVLRSTVQVAPGDAIAVRLAVGRVAANVTLVDPPADASSGLR